jgi:hypothetical protein
LEAHALLIYVLCTSLVDPTDSFSAVLGVFWQRWDALGAARDPFKLPPMLGSDLVDAMARVGVPKPDQALEEMQDRCLIYKVKEGEFRLVYPHMVEQYASVVSPKYGLSLKEMHNLLPNVGRRGEAEELDVLRHVAEQHGTDVVADVSVSEIIRDVEARAHRNGSGRCLYKPRDDKGSGTHARGCEVCGCDGLSSLVFVTALDGVLVTYDANGKVVDVAFYQVKFYPSPNSAVRLRGVFGYSESLLISSPYVDSSIWRR